MEEIKTALENPWIFSISMLIIGGLITQLFSKFVHKSGVFSYYIIKNRIALSTADTIFGNVGVTWEGHEVRNLYAVNIDIENSTTNDYENVEITVFTGNETILLNEHTYIDGTPDVIDWTDEFSEKMLIPEGGEATESQTETYRHRREYNIKTFNRGKTLKFQYVCTRPNDDLEPGVFVNTNTKGVKLKIQPNPSLILNPIFGVPVPISIKRAILIAIITVIICGLFLQNVWLVALVSMGVGLAGQLFGAMLYRIEKFLKDLCMG